MNRSFLIIAVTVLICLMLSEFSLSARKGSGDGNSEDSTIPYSESKTGEVRNETLQKALNRMHIRPKELGFDKKWASDEGFRLSIIDTLLDNPLRMSTYAEEAGNVADTLCDDLPALVTYVSRELDAGLKEETRDEMLERLPASFAIPTGDRAADEGECGPLSPLLHTLELSESCIEKGFRRLSEGEKDLVLMIAPQFWGDEDDTTSPDLRGALHFELGAPVDTTVEVEADSILVISKKIDQPMVHMAAYVLASGVSRYLDCLTDSKPDTSMETQVPGVGGQVAGFWETSAGRVVLGGNGNNEYCGDFTLIVDPGGDDVYRGRVGGAVGELDRYSSLVVDLGGDDYYDSADALFSLGAGIFGIGMIVDIGGDDTYRGHHYSQGAGFFGVGILQDLDGRDMYEGGYFCQGAGNFGLGFLLDRGGNDGYRAESWAQGFGSTFGYGLLVDRSGNDAYQAGSRYIHHPLRPEDYRSFAQGFGMGFRPDAGGGIGFLYDGEGNDFYNVEIYGQGTSYWYSLGMLVDGEGNDFYNATQYSQGAGIHLSVGILCDYGKGEDHLYSRFGPAQGEGHDLSCGLLENEGGNDAYMVSGGQGIGLTNSVGFFIDGHGDDVYSTTEGYGQGSVRWARDFAGFGLFLDLEGRDSYPGKSPALDAGEWVQQQWGIGIDLDRDVLEPEEVVPEVVIEPEDTLRTVGEIFEEASLWEVAENRYRVRKARKCLELKGMEAVHHILENEMDTDSGLALRAIVELARAFPDSFGRGLLETLQSDERHTKANSIYLLGELKTAEAINPLTEMLESPRKNERYLPGILQALGKMEDPALAMHVAPFLTYHSERSRLAAAGALGRLKNTEAIDDLIDSLDDPYFTVRSAASSALRKYDPPKMDVLCKRLPDLSGRALPLGIEILGSLAEKMTGSETDTLRVKKFRRQVRGAISPYLESEDPVVRAAAVKAGYSAGGEYFRAYIDMLMEDEFDGFVLGKYRDEKSNH
jgi:hypothetical protein